MESQSGVSKKQHTIQIKDEITQSVSQSVLGKLCLGEVHFRMLLHKPKQSPILFLTPLYTIMIKSVLTF